MIKNKINWHQIARAAYFIALLHCVPAAADIVVDGRVVLLDDLSRYEGQLVKLLPPGTPYAGIGRVELGVRDEQGRRFAIISTFPNEIDADNFFQASAYCATDPATGKSKCDTKLINNKLWVEGLGHIEQVQMYENGLMISSTRTLHARIPDPNRESRTGFQYKNGLLIENGARIPPVLTLQEVENQAAQIKAALERSVIDAGHGGSDFQILNVDMSQEWLRVRAIASQCVWDFDVPVEQASGVPDYSNATNKNNCNARNVADQGLVQVTGSRIKRDMWRPSHSYDMNQPGLTVSQLRFLVASADNLSADLLAAPVALIEASAPSRYRTIHRGNSGATTNQASRKWNWSGGRVSYMPLLAANGCESEADVFFGGATSDGQWQVARARVTTNCERSTGNVREERDLSFEHASPDTGLIFKRAYSTEIREAFWTGFGGPVKTEIRREYYDAERFFQPFAPTDDKLLKILAQLAPLEVNSLEPDDNPDRSVASRVQSIGLNQLREYVTVGFKHGDCTWRLEISPVQADGGFKREDVQLIDPVAGRSKSPCAQDGQ